ncbi:hypothetical protein BD408DRAFT_442510 [Parasitella parasitica]|nr:hypothetical protein BD408DRAFT_442510 [Parasitella parasitica]
MAILTSTAMALPNNSTVPNNGMGGTAATTSITATNPNEAKSASTRVNYKIVAITLISALSAAYILIDDYKQKNDQYWKIIEKQRLIIETLQKSLDQVTKENDILTKRNRKLELSIGNDTVPSLSKLDRLLQQPFSTGIASAALITTATTTPTVPPKSPFRANHHQITIHPLDVTSRLSKRPPVLELAMSNHTHFQRKDMSQAATTTSNKANKAQHKRNHSQSSNHDNLNISVLYKSKSEPSTPAYPRTPRYDSLYNSQLEHAATPTTPTTILRNLSNINVKTIASRKTNEKRFRFAVFQEDKDREIWKIEKSLSDMISLDLNLKSASPPGVALALKKLPDKSLFATNALVKVDERKMMAQDYLQHAIALRFIDNGILCEFLSSDRIQEASITLTSNIGTKEGYLAKKGKNFGGWKSRYFVLDHSGILKYYETKNGVLLRKIKLANSQIASQYQYESEQESNFRYAFFIIEPKSKSGSHCNHVFCADSGAERDEWINSLRFYTNQLNTTDKIINPSFDNDEFMNSDPLVVEPSSFTESNKPSRLKKSPSPDYVLNYFQQANSNRRRSSASKTSSPTFSADSSSIDTPILTTRSAKAMDEHLEEQATKSKHRNYPKAFWTKKIFGSHSDNPTSPHILNYGTSDYEETCGPNQVFGIPLKNVVAASRACAQHNLPAIVYRCIEFLEARGGLIEEGIYRLSGSSTKIKTLKKRFNELGDVLLLEDEEHHDVHAIVGLLKMWLREMPENILTEALLGDFLNSIRNVHSFEVCLNAPTYFCNGCVDLDEKQTKISHVGRLVSTLPLVNYTLLRSLCAHLICVIENANTNRMTLKNISIVFSATLGIPSSIFIILFQNFDYIFWTERCEKQCMIEDTIKIYKDKDVFAERRHQGIANPLIKHMPVDVSPDKCIDGNSERSGRNSILYKENTPKEFIMMEKQLDAALEHSQLEDENYYYCSDSEPEVAYFASRYNANSSKSN